MMETPLITLVSSDNQKIDIDSESAQKSNLLKGLISDFNVRQEPVQLPDIKFDILKKVVDYLKTKILKISQSLCLQQI